MGKIGRNDPCPCGSGKKYKKCHLGRDEGASEGPEGQNLGNRLDVEAELGLESPGSKRGRQRGKDRQ